MATPMGFGGNASDKYRTALFRRTFTVENSDRIQSLSFSMLADEGASIYINGQEVLRQNLPDNLRDRSLTTNTLASENGNEASYTGTTMDLADFPGLLANGTNTIAVEVHQVTAGSSDLGFDLSLHAVLSRPPGLGGVLANDTDADGDDLTAVLRMGPMRGALSLKPDGTFTYTPNAGFEGVDRFTYRAFDGHEYSAPATVTIRVGSSTTFPVDLDEDGFVDRADIVRLLAEYGTTAEGSPRRADLDGNGAIGITDVIELRNAFSEAAPASLVSEARSGSRRRIHAVRADRANNDESHLASSAVDEVFATRRRSLPPGDRGSVAAAN